MALNDAAMVLAANTLRSALAYAQLHSAAAGASGTANLTTATRQPVSWGAPTGSGSFMLASQINFTGGNPSSAVYSVTLWDTAVSGNFYGEFILSGDAIFDTSGNYSVTAIDLTGSAT